jgi:hypothetical protein
MKEPANLMEKGLARFIQNNKLEHVLEEKNLAEFAVIKNIFEAGYMVGVNTYGPTYTCQRCKGVFPKSTQQALICQNCIMELVSE